MRKGEATLGGSFLLNWLCCGSRREGCKWRFLLTNNPHTMKTKKAILPFPNKIRRMPSS